MQTFIFINILQFLDIADQYNLFLKFKSLRMHFRYLKNMIIHVDNCTNINYIKNKFPFASINFSIGYYLKKDDWQITPLLLKSFDEYTKQDYLIIHEKMVLEMEMENYCRPLKAEV